jgi:hypothetical protein
MTLFRRPVAIFAIVLGAALPGVAHAQRSDSYTWKLGFEAGGMAFQTNSQDTKVVPAAGAHILIMAHRGGLLFGVDEGIGSNEQANGGLVLFNDVRRYQGVLMAFPIAGPIEPYFGLGGGIMQVVGPRINAIITDPTDRQTELAAAQDASSSGFFTGLAGVQWRMGRLNVFVQYQASTSPSSDNLLHGAAQTLMGGIRIGLGAAQEGVTAGGY